MKGNLAEFAFPVRFRAWSVGVVCLLLWEGLSTVQGGLPEDLATELDEVIRQRTPGIRDEERPVINRLLQILPQQDEHALEREGLENLGELKQAAAGRGPNGGGDFSLFGELLHHPEDSGGISFPFRGALRRLEQFDTLRSGGIERPVYEGWVFTPDSAGHPWVVLVSELPEGLVPSDKMHEAVEFTGYFVKLSTYQAQDGRRVAPVIVAPRLHRVLNSVGNSVTSLWLYGGLAGVLLLGCVWWWRRRVEAKDRRRLRDRLEATVPFDPVQDRPIDSGSET